MPEEMKQRTITFRGFKDRKVCQSCIVYGHCDMNSDKYTTLHLNKRKKVEI
jgi:hypothetical protein